MRFIRKGGRVIPIKDDSFYKTPRGKASRTAQNVGMATVAGGLVAKGAAHAFNALSDVTGMGALEAAHIAKRGGGGAKAKQLAVGLAKESLKFGARAGRLSNAGQAAIYLGGTALLGGIALSAHKLPKRGKKK